ncbi:hypothetical protein BKA70DRAFT_1369231 [Coprinopsis sp. MPI-PUGE-AT-0042]|nr:hypothetical protein BKA70DRAFT_1369231 [Coprinopsis sp. MPI-PUGE-AT-0042]
MASKRAAESTLYHVSSKGFWKQLRDAIVVNPEISTGLPLPTEHRFPPPASRPEIYNTPATKASDPAQNPYWKRDVRRSYPQLSVVTQPELSQLLIEHSSAPSVAAPGESASVPAKAQNVDLAQAIATVTKSNKVYTEAKLPPALPTPYARWKPQLSPPAPHTPYSYWPMDLYH